MSLENYSDFLLNFSVCDVNGKNRHFYQFKSFRLDVEERQLLDNGSPVPLMPRVFDVLAVLVERNGHLVEKNELLNTVWADTFVEEANIARIIHELRKVLGEDKNGNKFIETVAKKGYRFVAKVTEIHEENEPKPAKETQKAVNVVKKPTVAPKRKTRIILFTVGFLTAVFLILSLSFNFQSNFSGNPNEIKSLAVLPVKPINVADRNEIYEVGIADSLIHRLGASKNLQVRPLNATRKYAAIEQDAIAAGKEQKTDYVLASNYQIADGKIRVTAQLFNVATGKIEETFKSEKNIGEIFAMQDAVADEIGKILLARFSAKENNPKVGRGTANEEAYRLYLQGTYLLENRDFEELRKSLEAFDEAVRLDPNYAQAWAGKAHAHRAVAIGRKANLAEIHQKSNEAINKALALDADLSEAHSALCEGKFIYEWDFTEAEKSCKRAIELNPNLSRAHQIYSVFLMGRGRFDEAIAEIKTAIDIEPASLSNQRLLGNCLQLARRYPEAVEQFKRVIEMDENFGTSYMFLSQTLALSGKETEAFEVWKQALAKMESDAETVRTFETAFQNEGWTGVIRVRAKQFEKGNEIFFHGVAYNALIGDKDKAFELLEKSFERRDWAMHLLKVDPRLDNLRDDPRFGDLVRRVGF